MMPPSKFSVKEHVILCQRIRETHHAIGNELAPLQLAIKEYRPKNRSIEAEGAVTIIAPHGTGFPKVKSNRL